MVHRTIAPGNRISRFVRGHRFLREDLTVCCSTSSATLNGAKRVTSSNPGIEVKTHREMNDSLESRLAPRYGSTPNANKKSRESARLAKPKLLHSTKLVHVLAAVALIGAVLIVADMMSRKSGAGPAIDFRNQQATIVHWLSTGFVKSIDDSSGTVVVNEKTWVSITRDKRMGIALFLRDYYSTRNGKQLKSLTVKGDASMDILARIALQPKE